MSGIHVMQPVTRQAIAAVGDDAPADWELDPQSHAEKLGAEAQALKPILLGPGLGRIIATYDEADRAAREAQQFYKRLARLSAWTGFGAALIGSLVLMSAFVIPLGLALTAAAAVQAALLLASLGSSLLIGSLQPFETWMLKRAEAENARISLFDHVMAAQAQSPAEEQRLLPLQLEYFRRFQLDVQRLYYRQRGEQHAAAARRAWRWRLVAFLLVTLAAFPLIWSIQGSAWLPSFVAELASRMPERTEVAQRLFLGLGIVAASLQGLLASYAVMSLDERNAARYHSTAENLESLAGRPLEDARAAAATAGSAGAREQVLAFVALVHEQISSEHREWIALRKVAPDLALERLKSLRLPPRG